MLGVYACREVDDDDDDDDDATSRASLPELVRGKPLIELYNLP